MRFVIDALGRPTEKWVTVDGAGLDILSTPLNRLRFTIAGPTSDYREYFQVSAQNNGANADGTLAVIDATAVPPHVVGVHGLCEGDVALHVEALHQLVPLVVEVGLDLISRGCPIPPEAQLELGGGPVCHHPNHPRHGQSLFTAEGDGLALNMIPADRGRGMGARCGEDDGASRQLRIRGSPLQPDHATE